MKNIFVILGKSGSGKTTLAEKLCENLEMSNVVVTTTRPVRDGEIDGVDYHFVSNEEFDDYIEKEEMLQHSSFRDWQYGIEKRSLDICSGNNIVLILSPKAFEIFNRNVCKQSYNIVPIYIYCDNRKRLQRSLNRDTDIEEIFRRYHADNMDFKGVEEIVLDMGGFIVNNSYSFEYALQTSQCCIEEYCYERDHIC